MSPCPLKKIRIHILPQQCHLFETFSLQVAELVEDALGFTATLTSTGVGHYAVGAEVVAATHDGDKAADAVGTDARGNDVTVGFSGRELHIDRLLAILGGGDEIRQLKVAVGTRHQIYTMVVDQLILHALSHTSDDTDDEPALALAAQGVEGI